MSPPAAEHLEPTSGLTKKQQCDQQVNKANLLKTNVLDLIKSLSDALEEAPTPASIAAYASQTDSIKKDVDRLQSLFDEAMSLHPAEFDALTNQSELAVTEATRALNQLALKISSNTPVPPPVTSHPPSHVFPPVVLLVRCVFLVAPNFDIFPGPRLCTGICPGISSCRS